MRFRKAASIGVASRLSSCEESATGQGRGSRPASCAVIECTESTTGSFTIASASTIIVSIAW